MTRIRNFIVNVFIGGVIVLLPIIIVFNIAQWLFEMFRENTQPLTNLLTTSFSLSEPVAWMLNLVGIFIIFSFIGMVVRTRIGSGLYQFLENVTLYRIPGYRTIKDIVAQITGKQKGFFRKVVLIQIGNTGVSATGFVVDEIGYGHSTVFIPCGPNPTTGFILHIKNEYMSDMNISVETAMKTIIACGAGSSQFVAANLFDQQVT
jgi:uncharacterized membrane protein